MERKIGEIFNYQDDLYQCIKSITCTNCGFNNKGCLADKHITGGLFLVVLSPASLIVIIIVELIDSGFFKKVYKLWN